MEFGSECTHCQLKISATHVLTNPPPAVYPKMSKPFDKVHMDLFGELPQTGGRQKYVLVFKCPLTKWVEYFALQDKSGVLITDGGKEFKNRTLKAICKLLKERKMTTAPYNQGQKVSREPSKKCQDMISSYWIQYQNDWEKYQSVVAHYYRTTCNDAIGMSPYKTLYRRECTQINTMWIADVLAGNQDLTDYFRRIIYVIISSMGNAG